MTSPEMRFLLAYQYMSCGFSDAAVAELKEVVRLSPKDQLSAQLLAALSQRSRRTLSSVGVRHSGSGEAHRRASWSATGQ